MTLTHLAMHRLGECSHPMMLKSTYISGEGGGECEGEARNNSSPHALDNCLELLLLVVQVLRVPRQLPLGSCPAPLPRRGCAAATIRLLLLLLLVVPSERLPGREDVTEPKGLQVRDKGRPKRTVAADADLD